MFLCPNCNTGMSQVQRAGVELDVCPQCRGVWLDRGELEKILDNERGNREAVSQRPTYYPEDRKHEDKQDHRSDHDRRSHNEHERRDVRGRRKGGFDILDIFG
jgi:Zn-finger nucleic acid-binding protein